MDQTASNLRNQALMIASSRKPHRFSPALGEGGRPLRPTEVFGLNTFDLKKMRDALQPKLFEKLVATVEAGRSIDREVADAVAVAVKEWALRQGATHFCHWFQPQTGSTAEKHDGFFKLDDEGRPVDGFSGEQLIQSEPDASSFPSGGVRSTFEARGYTAWDPTSPFFIMEGTNSKTLCVPSAFISYYGDALDEKTGLLRSMDAVSARAAQLIELLGEEKPVRVVATLGPEQEYFLIDRSFFTLRPDLIMSGRTLLGAEPSRGQQLEDHYFGSIPARVLAFMSEFEYELAKLGVPVKTRHNEVAPSQFETAPIFEEANVSTDHNQLVMDILQRVAHRHDFEAILHEKPFAGLNGSGKHCNWSLSIHDRAHSAHGENLLNPGKTPHQNLRFLCTLGAVLKGVHSHSGLLRAGIASHGNDHRLGANEAPPAIISVFLGQVLSEVLDSIEQGTEFEEDSAKQVIDLGVDRIPKVAKDNTDRNRTSPFAFTGNKFEFRAVGGASSTALPVTLLNAAVADGLEYVTQLLKEKIESGASVSVAVMQTLKQVITETKDIRFEGNNYSEEWVKEAEKRGLPNLKKTPESLEQLITKESKNLLTRLSIFSESEIDARYHVRLERYVKHLMIEVDTFVSLVQGSVLPATDRALRELADSAVAQKNAGLKPTQDHRMKDLWSVVNQLSESLDRVIEMRALVLKEHDERTQAELLATRVSEAMTECRTLCDTLEGMLPDDLWPLPKYREMLFIH